MTGAGFPLVLASASPRRLELLRRLGVQIVRAPTNIDETPWPGEAPPAHTLRVAREKARTAACSHPDLPVLAADTVVVLGDRILGKPASRPEALEMLTALAGRDHLVMTAVAAAWSGRESTRLVTARVTFMPFDPELFAWYAGSGECDDKAGAYAVQGRGALLVARVEGNVQAVVGLPLAILPSLFGDLGLGLSRLGDQLALRTLANH
jgi:septum formation protein